MKKNTFLLFVAIVFAQGTMMFSDDKENFECDDDILEYLARKAEILMMFCYRTNVEKIGTFPRCLL